MYQVNEWILFAIAVALLLGCVEIGYRFGCKALKSLGKDAYPHIATIEGALLGLLALLLGFAFSMSMSRYDSRRIVVLEEANDIQTTYLRSKLLPSPHRERIGELLKSYVDSRIDYLRAGTNLDQIQSTLKRATTLQDELWRGAIESATVDSNEV